MERWILIEQSWDTNSLVYKHWHRPDFMRFRNDGKVVLYKNCSYGDKCEPFLAEISIIKNKGERAKKADYDTHEKVMSLLTKMGICREMWNSLYKADNWDAANEVYKLSQRIYFCVLRIWENRERKKLKSQNATQ
jgi:hypothetical protein